MVPERFRGSKDGPGSGPILSGNNGAEPDRRIQPGEDPRAFVARRITAILEERGYALQAESPGEIVRKRVWGVVQEVRKKRGLPVAASLEEQTGVDWECLGGHLTIQRVMAERAAVSADIPRPQRRWESDGQVRAWALTRSRRRKEWRASLDGRRLEADEGRLAAERERLRVGSEENDLSTGHRLRLFFRKDEYRTDWLRRLVLKRLDNGDISPGLALTLLDQASNPTVLRAVRDVGAYTLVELGSFGLSLTIPQAVGLCTGDWVLAGKLNGAMHTLPLSLGGLMRGAYCLAVLGAELAKAIKEGMGRGTTVREAVEVRKSTLAGYGLALVISPVRAIGFFTPAIFIAANAPQAKEMAGFMLQNMVIVAEDTINFMAKLVSIVPLTGRLVKSAARWANRNIVRRAGMWVKDKIDPYPGPKEVHVIWEAGRV